MKNEGECLIVGRERILAEVGFVKQCYRKSINES